HAHNRGGDTLAHLGLGGRAGVVDEIGVGVDVDEARGDHQPLGVDGARSRPAQPRPESGDPITLDGHIRGDARSAAAVHHGAALDQERPGHDSYSAVSMIFTDFILSPFLMLSPIFFPHLTFPKKVSFPSRYSP